MSNNNNVINITKCDNQLIMFAVSQDQTIYLVARVGSGPSVDVKIHLEKGTYTEPEPIYNPGPSSDPKTVNLPQGTYDIYYAGFNCGGPYNFKFSLNGLTHELLNGGSDDQYGFIWCKGGTEKSSITVDIN